MGYGAKFERKRIDGGVQIGFRRHVPPHRRRMHKASGLAWHCQHVPDGIEQLHASSRDIPSSLAICVDLIIVLACRARRTVVGLPQIRTIRVRR
jgi:hypothetical protein